MHVDGDHPAIAILLAVGEVDGVAIRNERHGEHDVVDVVARQPQVRPVSGVHGLVHDGFAAHF